MNLLYIEYYQSVQWQSLPVCPKSLKRDPADNDYSPLRLHSLCIDITMAGHIQDCQWESIYKLVEHTGIMIQM